MGRRWVRELVCEFEHDSQTRAASPQKWAPTEHRPPSLDGRCRAACAFGAPFVPNGGMTSVSSQDSGAERRPRGACESGTDFCLWNAIPRQGRLRRKNGTPTARRPYHLFSMGAAAPIARRAIPSFQMVGSARRSGPKLQARSAVSGALRGSGTGLRIRMRFSDKSGSAANMGPRRSPARSLRLGERGVPTIYFREALPRRSRIGRPDRSPG